MGVDVEEARDIVSVEMLIFCSLVSNFGIRDNRQMPSLPIEPNYLLPRSPNPSEPAMLHLKPAYLRPN